MSNAPKINQSILTAAVGMLSQFYPDVTPTVLVELLEQSKNAKPKSNMLAEKPYTIQEVADLLGFSTQTINRMLNRGDLRRIHVGKRAVRIDPVSVRSLLENGYQGNTVAEQEAAE